MSYGRFLDYVEAGRVTAVDIYDGGRNAVVEAVDPDPTTAFNACALISPVLPLS